MRSTEPGLPVAWKGTVRDAVVSENDAMEQADSLLSGCQTDCFDLPKREKGRHVGN